MCDSQALRGRAQLQGSLAQKKLPCARILQQNYAEGSFAVLGGGAVSYDRGTPVGIKAECWTTESVLDVSICVIAERGVDRCMRV